MQWHFVPTELLIAYILTKFYITWEDLKKSLQRQKEILNPNGIVFHSFWKGSKTEDIEGLLFTYYEMNDLKKMTESNFDVLTIETYAEMEKDDSIYVILRNK